MVGKQSNATKNISLKMLSRKIYNQKIVTDVRKIRSQSKLSHILSNKKKPKVVRKAIKVDATRSNKASRMVGKKNNTIKTISSKRQSRKIDHRKNVSSSRKTRSQTKLIDIMSVKKKSKVGPKKKINILERKPIKVDAARSSRNQRTSNVLNCASEDGKDTKGTKEKIDSIKYKEMSEKRTRIRPVPYWLNETRIKYVRLPNGCCEIAKHSDETSVEETKDPKKNMKTSRQKLSISDENTLEPNSIHSSPQEDDSSSWLTVEEKIYFGQGNSCTSLFASSPRSLSVDVNRSQFRVMASDEPEKSERNISSSTNMGPEKLTSAKPASAIVVEQNIDYGF
ncbi:uncharacterized protein LOC113372956 isoform X2 [Ctenocephalides felis]|nr:uncharacterized protein LOC113372956 isoform X2 [Ctenocephalides felis]